MTVEERQLNRAKKAIGKEMRVCMYKRKNLDEASIFCNGVIKECTPMGLNEEGTPIFSVVLVAGKENKEHEVVVDHLPR